MTTLLTGHTHMMSVITHHMSDNPLLALFSSRSLVRLLSVLLMNPERSYYQQELVRKIGGPLRPTQLALDKLVRAGLVDVRRDGRQVYYRVVITHPAYPDLRTFFEKTFALGDVLRSALEPLADSVQLAFVYGSVAAGEQRASSDVDLLVVGSAGRRDIASALGETEAHLGREVNLSLYTPARLSAAIRDADPFVRDVLDGPKTWLVGGQDELERLAR